MKNRGAGGLTLIEIIVAAGLALLLLGMLHQFLVPVLFAGSKTSVRVHVAQQANLALNSLAKEIRAAGAAGLSYSGQTAATDPVVLAVCPRAGIANTGRQVYATELSVFFWDPSTGRLSKSKWPPAPPTLSVTPDPARPTVLTSAQLLQFQTVAQSSKLLAEDVAEFAPLPSYPPPPVVEMRLVIEKEVPGQDVPERFEMTRSVAFRNR